MKNFSYLFLFPIFVFFLAACSPENSTPPTATPITVLNPVLPATPTQTFSCSVVVQSDVTPVAESLIPAVTEADYSIGPADAAVTVVEYCDFQSQGCLSMAQTMGEIMRNHEGKIRFVFRPLPLIDILDKSDDSTLAALAAADQGKFWEMYDLLFVKYAEWVNLSEGQFKSWLSKEAPGVGIDEKKLSEAMKAQEINDQLQSAYEAAKLLGIPAVPLVMINGTIQNYVLDYRNLSDTIGLILLGEKQFTECPPFVIDVNKQYLATVETSKGKFVIQLFPDKAPLAVNSFVFLAREGWYDGVTFHRVIPGFAAQAGDPSGTGRGNPGYFFDNETNDLLFSKPGVVGMANSGPDTNGSQFFITFAPAAHLNRNYTIFGQVISGLDVVEQFVPRDPSQSGILSPGDMILHVTIEEK